MTEEKNQGKSVPALFFMNTKSYFSELSSKITAPRAFSSKQMIFSLQEKRSTLRSRGQNIKMTNIPAESSGVIKKDAECFYWASYRDSHIYKNSAGLKPCFFLIYLPYDHNFSLPASFLPSPPSIIKCPKSPIPTCPNGKSQSILYPF